MKKIILITVLCLSASLPSFSRETRLKTDSSRAISLVRLEPSRKTKSPTLALSLSLAFPGLGQIYDESYWKAPLFIGGAGTLLYFIFKFDGEFRDWQKKWETTPEDSYLKGIYKQKKEFYRDNRDMAIFYLLGVYALSAVDAYVDANLFGFDVSDDLSIRIGPSKGNLFNLSMSYSFSLRDFYNRYR